MELFKKIYVVEIVKYNLGEPCLSFDIEFNAPPTELDMKDVLIKCDEKYPKLKHYDTIIHLSEYYRPLRDYSKIKSPSN